MATQQKSKTTTRQATKANTTARTSRSQATTKAHERDAKVVAVDAAYALTGLATDALQLAGEALDAARELPGRVRGARTSRTELEKRFRELRDRLEERFDEKAIEGRTVTDNVLKDQRVKRILTQAQTARSQVKGALTSIRKTASKTVEAGAAAGRKQADTAKSQTKAAATSVQKAAEAVVDAGRDLMSDDDRS
ncbi:MAG TPA: hypothetical protein VHF25_07530 [Nitriliruptorales bacterium]|nr:hypothetical protein [Nitriliruptorales bacterium]